MGWTVLILEDDADLRDALIMTLEDENYMVHGAANGVEALRLFAQHKFDVAVADVRMEGQDGIEVLRALKQAHPPLPCIVMTGYASADAPTRALQVQVDDYLYKPFKAEDLLAAIARLEQKGTDRQRYESLFGKVLGGYRKLVQRVRDRFEAPTTAPIGPAEQYYVETGRNAAFRNFYVGVRSGKLDARDGVQVWNLLEYAERRRDELFERGNCEPDEVRKLYDGYQSIAQLIAELSTSRLSERPPQAGQVSSEAFGQLYTKVKGGQLSLEQVKMAPALRRADPVAVSTDPELRSLLRAVW